MSGPGYINYCEGKNDRAALEIVAQRLGLDIDGRGVKVKILRLALSALALELTGQSCFCTETAGRLESTCLDCNTPLEKMGTNKYKCPTCDSWFSVLFPSKTIEREALVRISTETEEAINAEGDDRSN